MVIAGVAVLIIVVAGVLFREKVRGAKMENIADESARSYEVKSGTISTTISGTGTLTADDVENIELLSLVDVDTVYVKAGDTVQEGDILASVDPVSVVTALKTLQDEMDDLDEQIEDEQGETISSSIKSGVSGRVKKICADVDDRVADVMSESGALLLLSLDGKMAVDIDASADIALGDTVTVTLSDGTEEDGTVESIQGTKAVVTVTDNGPAYEEEVKVSKDGKELGSGKLYIHSELAVTGYAGTISKISVKENAKVSDGTVLFKLTDLPGTAEYEKLVAERAEMADALGQIVALYNNPNLYAAFSGTVQSVNCEDAEYVEIVSSASSTDSKNGGDVEKTTDAETEEDKQQKNAADSLTEGNRQTSTTGVSKGVISLGTVNVSTGGVIRASEIQSAADSSSSAAGQVEDSDQNTQDGTGETENGSDQSSGSDAEETQEPQKEAVEALQQIEIAAPVTGETVQTAVTDAAQYSASIGWNQAVTGTYNANTVYTATVTLRAKDGYYFDGSLLTSYEKAVTANGAEITLKISENQAALTITAVFPATQEKTIQEDTGVQNTQETTNTQSGSKTQAPTVISGVAVSGGSGVKGVSTGYTTSSVSSAASSSEQEQNLNTYTATTAVFTVSRDEKMSVSLSVDEQDILKLSEGQTAQASRRIQIRDGRVKEVE